MTLLEAIKRTKKEKPNACSDESLVSWVNDLEHRIAELFGHDSTTWVTFTVDDIGTDEDASPELLMPSPYEDLYIAFLKSKIDYVNEDYESYSNHQAMFSQIFLDAKSFALRNGVRDNTWPTRYKNVF